MRVFLFLLFAATSFVSCSSGEENISSTEEKYVDDGLLALVIKGKKYGFINSNNKVVIPLDYDQATTFSEGLACVKKDGKWKFINANNEIVIDNLNIEYPTRFKEGYARVHMGFGNMRFIDKKGGKSKEGFERLYEFNNGLAKAISKGFKQHGFINPQGEWVIKYTEKKPDDLSDFSEGIASFRIAGDINKFPTKKGFMNTKGETTIEAQYKEVGPFVNGIARANKADIWHINKWGYINKKGEPVIEFQYDEAFDFRDGLAFVKKGANGLMIDSSGTTIFELGYNAAYVFTENLAPKFEEKKRKWGYINKSGEWLIQPQFDKVYDFNNGFAIIENQGRMGFINKKGEIVIAAIYERVDHFVHPKKTNAFLQTN